MANFGQLWPTSADLRPSWANLEPTWSQLGANLAPTWAKLKPTWGLLRAFLGHLGPTWANLGQHGAILGQHGRNLRPILANLRPTWGQLGPTSGHQAAPPENSLQQHSGDGSTGKQLATTFDQRLQRKAACTNLKPALPPAVEKDTRQDARDKREDTRKAKSHQLPRKTAVTSKGPAAPPENSLQQHFTKSSTGKQLAPSIEPPTRRDTQRTAPSRGELEKQELSVSSVVGFGPGAASLFRKSASKFGFCRHLGQKGPQRANFWPTWANLVQLRPNMVPSWPKLGRFSLILRSPWPAFSLLISKKRELRKIL